MSKIGDLFVRLGLKSDDYQKGIEQAKRDTQNFGSSLKTMSTLAKTAWAAVAAAVIKFAADAIKMTQQWGDQWAIEMEGIKGAYGAFVRQISSGEGWSNLFANMAEAARVAKEVAASLDEIFERKVSLSYEEAEANKTISELQLVMRDASKSDEERMAAAREVIRLEKELGVTKRDIAQQEADAQKKLFMSQTGLTAQETDYLLKNYNLNRDSINESRAYLAEKTRLEKSIRQNTRSAGRADEEISEGLFKAMADASREQLAEMERNTPQAFKDIAELTRKYDKSSDDLVQNMATAEIAVINVDTEINRASTRASSMLGTLTKAANTGVSTGSTGKADPGLSKALGIQQGAEDSSKSETQLLTEKYNTEKALLEQYQLDTTTLTKKYYKDLFDILDKGVDEELAKLSEIEPIELDLIDMSEVDAEIDEFTQKLEEDVVRAQEAAWAFSDAITGGFADASEELMGQLMGLKDFNPGSVVQALLTPLCDLAEKAGAIIMAEGLATIAAKSALETFGVTGWGAVAAGAALIAAGAAAKAGLSALAGGSSTPAASTPAASTYSGASGSGNSTQSIESEMTVYVTGRISGSDILISGQRTADNWAR